jgi:MFS family permease
MGDDNAPPDCPLRPSFVLAMLLVVYTFNFIDRQIFGILATPIKTELNLSDTQLGALGGFAFALLYSTMGLPLAWLGDRRGARRSSPPRWACGAPLPPFAAWFQASGRCSCAALAWAWARRAGWRRPMR